MNELKRSGAPLKYPWDSMLIGETFELSLNEDDNRFAKMASLASSASSYAKRHETGARYKTNAKENVILITRIH